MNVKEMNEQMTFNVKKICTELQRRFNLRFREKQDKSMYVDFSWKVADGGIIVTTTRVIWSSPKLIEDTYCQFYSSEKNTDEGIIETITRKMVALHPRKYKMWKK